METSFIFSSGTLEIKNEGENFYVEGYISTSDKDLVNDIITKNCLMDMAEQMRTRTIKLDMEHESFRGKSQIESEINKTIIPVAKIEDFLMDKKGLKVRAMLNRHIPRFNEIKNSIKEGFIDAFSIAFVPVKATIQEKDGENVRMLEKINLLNVAFTGNPINTYASIEKVFMKSLDFLDTQDNIHVSDTIIKLQEVKNMEENKKNLEVAEVKDEVVAEVEAEEVAEVEAPAEEVVEAKPEVEELKEVENTEVKDLKAEVDSLKIELAEVKSLMSKSVKKSKIEQVDKTANFEDKSQNPLDLI